MVKKESSIERQLSNKEIDGELGKIKFRSEKQAKLFYFNTQQTWFRQYAKGSKAALAKIAKKVKSGIIHQKYGNSPLTTLDDGWKRFVKPKPQKKLKATKKKIVEQQKKVKVKSDKKQRQKVKQTERRAPSGRAYSSTEIREGIGSKRASAYREKHGIKKEDWSYES